MKNLKNEMFLQHVKDIYTGEMEEFADICKDIYEEFTDSIPTYNIPTDGVITSFSNWLRGLPNSVDVMCYRDEIQELFEDWGIEVENSNIDLFKEYYDGITNVVLENLY